MNLMEALNVRFVHTIPAFASALFSGACVLDLLHGVAQAWAESSWGVLVLSPLMFTGYALLYAPAAALVFFPTMVVLRLAQAIRWPVMGGLGSATGYLLSSELELLPLRATHAAVAGAVGGLMAFLVLRACTRADKASRPH